MVQGRHFLMFGGTYIANVCEYKILHFWANPQKYQTLVPAKNSHVKTLDEVKYMITILSIVTILVLVHTQAILYTFSEQ